ncbi:hypothetical protein BLNAU_11051 [Blattamonas nauphoetae]|uniref:Protein kinase domain-containing protein n=1 Tax=Blattamonas nauphoetae TaxID=2049346 RepID=A0ABQ9XS81_9EUKA|nr:hypothetical protein BLNAU_11051 [Blattamonas nauphoetae]
MEQNAEGSTELSQELSVCGIGLDLADTELILGTGPLFDFRPKSHSAERTKVRTQLVGTLLLNVTSPSTPKCINSSPFASVRQSITASHIAHSSNYLSGTAINEMNEGGDLFALNSSFVSCTAGEPAHLSVHYTTQTRLSENSTLNSFRLCTFKFTPTTAVPALVTNYRYTDLIVESCSFHTCQGSSTSAAIMFVLNPDATNVLVVTSTSFENCSAGWGSCVYGTLQFATISECVFLDCSATGKGGAIWLSKWNVRSADTGISNCLFQNCRTSGTTYTSGGGAINLYTSTSILLSSLQFRQCQAANANGHILYIAGSDAYPIPPLSSATIVDCFSDQTDTAKLIYPAEHSNLISTTLQPASVTSLILVTTRNGTNGSMIVQLDQIVSGMLLVLVSNGRGTRTPTEGSAPNIGRLVVFSLNSASEGTIPVSTGEQGLLQHDLEEYTILAASLPDRDVSSPSGPITVVYLPELLSTSCDLDESRTKAVLHLRGMDLEDGEYVLTLHELSTFNVVFSTDPEGVSTGKVTLGEIGHDSKWKEGVVFSVTNLNKQNQRFKPSIGEDVIFTIPSVARLISISVEEESEASKTDVTLSFVSSRLEKNSEYWLGVAVDAQETNSEVISIGVLTNGDGKIVDKKLSLFPFAEDEEERKKQLEFGVRYKVEWLRLGSSVDSVVIDSVVFEMPSERVRVSGASCSADRSTSTVVSITGSGFVIGETYTMTVSGTPKDTPTGTAHIAEIRVHGKRDDEAASSSIPLSSTSEEGSLRYDYRYTVTGITNGSLPGFVKAGVFVVPSHAHLISISVEEESEASKTDVTLSFVSSRLEKNSEYWLGVAVDAQETNSEVISIGVLTNGDGKIVDKKLSLFPFAEDEEERKKQLEFGVRYKVEWLRLGSSVDSVVIDSVVFEMPSERVRVSGASCSADRSTSTVVSITGSGFVIGETYTMTVSGTPKDTPTGTAHIAEIQEGSLRYDYRYTVTGITNGSLPGFVKAGVFVVPSHAHLISISVEEESEASKTDVTLSFVSSRLEKNSEYWLGVAVDAQETNSEVISIGVLTNGDGKIVDKKLSLFPFAEDEEERKKQLEFGVRYKVEWLRLGSSVDSVVIDSVVFEMPSERVRVSGASCSADRSTSTVVSITGSGFVIGETYTMTVSGTPKDTPTGTAHIAEIRVHGKRDDEAASSSIPLSSTSEEGSLRYDYRYTVTGITNGSLPGFVKTGVFNTPIDLSGPVTSLSKISLVPIDSQNTQFEIIFEGEHLHLLSQLTLILDDILSLPLLIETDKIARSDSISLGIDTLDFAQSFSITLQDQNEDPIPCTVQSITMPPKPLKIVFYVCASSVISSTCSSLVSSWGKAQKLSIQDTTMQIVSPSDLSSPLHISSALSFVLMSSSIAPASLSISSPVSVGPALLTITSQAVCHLSFLKIVSSSSNTFVFIDSNDASLNIQFCSISSSSSTTNEEHEICSWNSGFIKLTDSATLLNSVTIDHLPKSPVWMSGGSLNVTKGEFSNNGASNTSFPSARQNIHCEGEGKLHIDSLAKGDGTKNTPSAWIDADTCSISGDQDIVSSPLFVPTLDSDASSTNFEKKTNTMHFTVKGEMLVPCCLDVEVFEWDSSKSVKGESALLSLHSITTTKWAETEIVGHVDLKTSLSSLKSSLEWRARLVFGNNRTTPNSFLFASASSTGKGNMSQGGVSSQIVWIIPVVVCVLLALILLIVLIVFAKRRRSTKKNEQSLLMNEEVSAKEMGELIVKEEDDNNDSTLNRVLNGEASISHQSRQPIVTKGDSENRTYSNDAFCPPSGKVDQTIPESMQREAIQCVHPFDTKVVSCSDSLFCRLHGRENERKTISWKRVASSVAKGLMQLHNQNPAHRALSALNPHRIVFDSNETISLVINHPTQTGPLSNFQHRQPHSLHPSKSPESGQNEGERWEAPEVKRNERQPKNECDQAKASVFSLGLVMFEMVTMTVPFGEVDGVNAHRQIASGTLPDLSKIEDDSTRDLISSCLSFNPNERPSLTSLSDSLDELTQTDPNTVALPSHNVVQ